MFQILPFLISSMALPDFYLPPELWSMILRNLDPASLLTAVRTKAHWLSVAVADPILRGRIRSQIQKEKKLKLEETLNPSILMTITRTEPAGMYQFNNNGSNKKIVWQPSRVPAAEPGQLPVERRLEEYEDWKVRKNGRRERSQRVAPYKNRYRC